MKITLVTLLSLLAIALLGASSGGVTFNFTPAAADEKTRHFTFNISAQQQVIPRMAITATNWGSGTLWS